MDGKDDLPVLLFIVESYRMCNSSIFNVPPEFLSSCHGNIVYYKNTVYLGSIAKWLLW